MDGLTIYYSDIKRGMDELTNEELGLVRRTIFECMQTGEIPTFEDRVVDIASIGFKNCLEKGFNRSKTNSRNGSKGGAPLGNQNARKNKEESDTRPLKPNTNFDVNENDLQLFLGYLEERKPQKNQTLNLLLNSNSSISGFCETNRISRATQEKAWDIYVNNK